MRYAGFTLLLPVLALADVRVSDQGDLVADACGYGRGAPAIEAATAKGSAELAEFITGSKQYSDLSSSEETVQSEETSTWLSSLRETHQSGISAGSLPVKVSASRLEGTDTCVTVTLSRGASLGGSDATVWEEGVRDVTVVVIGEGWPNSKRGVSARSQAELDALKRAVSQVVGLWLNRQRSDYSTSELQVTGNAESTSLQDIIAEQLHTRSSGMVKEWTLLDSKPLANDGIQVTIQAVVEKQQVAAASDELLAAIGSPRVKVAATGEVESYLKQWLVSQGIEVSDEANLVIAARSDLRRSGNNSRLHLDVSVLDLSGNQYGHWQNDSSLLALPSHPDVARDLIQVHLAADSQAEALNQTLRSAFTRVVAQGGLVRNVSIAKRYLTQSDKLAALAATIGGAKDVVVTADDEFTRISLRFPGGSGQLVSALQQSLRPILSAELPLATMQSDYDIIFK